MQKEKVIKVLRIRHFVVCFLRRHGRSGGRLRTVNKTVLKFETFIPLLALIN